jgi:hypothetical protein
MLVPIAICLLSEILPGLASVFFSQAIPLIFVGESGYTSPSFLYFYFSYFQGPQKWNQRKILV